MLFIFSNSLKNSDESMRDSNGIKAIILTLFSYFGVELENTFFIEFIRKFGHFAEYFLLGTELMIFKLSYMRKGANSFVNVIFAGVLTAFIDESIQLIPSLGRSAEVIDLWIDIGGVLSAFLVVYLISLIVNAIKKGRN